MRADFVANASHEIRTPLATLMGFIETLQGSARDDAAARERFLAIMDQHGRRMARLVEDLLSLSRIEMNEHTPPTDSVPLPSLLSHVRNTLAWQADRRGVTVAIDADDGMPPVIGDGDELTQVFLNLVDNAIKYGAEKGTVSVEVHRGCGGRGGRLESGQGRCGRGLRRRSGRGHSARASAAPHGALLSRGTRRARASSAARALGSPSSSTS